MAAWVGQLSEAPPYGGGAKLLLRGPPVLKLALPSMFPLQATTAELSSVRRSTLAGLRSSATLASASDSSSRRRAHAVAISRLIRCTVPTPIPSALAVLTTPVPFVNSVRTLASIR
jgi:hypothetical protein